MSRFTMLFGSFYGAQHYGALLDHCSYGEILGSDLSEAGQAGGSSTEFDGAWNGVHIRHMSKVNFAHPLSDIRLNQEGESDNDLRVAHGGMADVTGSFLHGGFAIEPNEVHPDGIIFWEEG